RPAFLIEYAARITDVHVAQQHLPGGAVELTFHSRVEGNAPGARVVHLVEGVAEPVADGQSVRIARPELWWPRGLGAQKLYRVESRLLSGRAPQGEGQDREVLDARTQRIGLRTIELLREPDAQGESFEFRVN